MTGATARPKAVLIAALGGEGGGVLSKWLVDLAEAEGMWAQATSIPGVAQRTGATTYYVELCPKGDDERAPVLALTPTPGHVDVMVASELLEAGRAIQNGFVTPDRTTLIASTHRVFSIDEKTAMADGRFDGERVLAAARQMAARPILADMGASAQSTGAMINAVLFGALAGADALAIPRAAFEEAIRRGAIAVESNLKGFDAGYRLAAEGAAEGDQEKPAAEDASADLPEPLARRLGDRFPAAARAVVRLGVARLIDYQDVRYASLYLDRLERLFAGDNGGRAVELITEVARHLAVWMSFEDLIRVAQLKTRPERLRRVRNEVGAAPDQPVVIAEFLKPGVEEWCSVLPPWLARALLGLAERAGVTHKLNVGMRVKTTTVSGFLPLWLLAKLKRWRRGTYRYAEEQAMIEDWLAQVETSADDPNFARELAGCAQLVKGYGDTHHRGAGNFRRVMAAAKALDGRPDAARQLSALRRAALADPEGDGLAKALQEVGAAPAAAE